MSNEPQNASAASSRAGLTLGDRFRAGGWYFVLVIGSAGLLSAIPVWHAWSRLRTPLLFRLAIVYTAFCVLTVVLIPRATEGVAEAETNENPAPALLSIVLMVSACIVLARPRRRVYGLPTPYEYNPPVDPAVQKALDNRSRRDAARSLVESDQHLARELRIGRPDLARDYDDGGLVDINAAPSSVIAEVCGIESTWADAVVSARESRGGVFYHHTELMLDVPFPPHVAERIRDRAVFIV